MSHVVRSSVRAQRRLSSLLSVPRSYSGGRPAIVRRNTTAGPSHLPSSSTASALASSSQTRPISTTLKRSLTKPQNPPKRPSPYRLLQPHTFLSDFAPLHIAGWRLDSISPQERLINPLSSVDENLSQNPNPRNVGDGGRDLQGRRLVRAYMMGEGKEGWRDTIKFTQSVGEAVEQEDHHPTILISPSSDYLPTSPSLTQSDSKGRGYIVEVSTHTHTPLPPYPLPTKGGDKMKPGITSKDIRLAQKLEEAWREVMGGREKVEVKQE